MKLCAIKWKSRVSNVTKGTYLQPCLSPEFSSRCVNDLFCPLEAEVCDRGSVWGGDSLLFTGETNCWLFECEWRRVTFIKLPQRQAEHNPGRPRRDGPPLHQTKMLLNVDLTQRLWVCWGLVWTRRLKSDWCTFMKRRQTEIRHPANIQVFSLCVGKRFLALLG